MLGASATEAVNDVDSIAFIGLMLVAAGCVGIAADYALRHGPTE